MSGDTTSPVSAAPRARRPFTFPTAATTLALVTLLVWVAALFVPSGQYRLDADGSPVPGTYEQVPSPLSFGESVQQLLLSPVNGVHGLLNPESGVVDTETLGHLYGQVGVIVFIMSIGAFISVSFATRSLEVAVAGLAGRLRQRGWLLIVAVMVLFALLGTTMGFSVETFGFYALFLPLMTALGYDRMVTVSMVVLGALSGVMGSTVNPFSIGWLPARQACPLGRASPCGSCCGCWSPRCRSGGCCATRPGYSATPPRRWSPPVRSRLPRTRATPQATPGPRAR